MPQPSGYKMNSPVVILRHLCFIKNIGENCGASMQGGGRREGGCLT